MYMKECTTQKRRQRQKEKKTPTFISKLQLFVHTNEEHWKNRILNQMCNSKLEPYTRSFLSLLRPSDFVGTLFSLTSPSILYDYDNSNCNEAF